MSRIPRSTSLIYRNAIWLGISLLLTGCATTPGQVLKSGATPMAKDELEALVTDRTEPWPQGANYYYPGGQLFVRWNNAIYKGAWEVKDGEICRYVPELLPVPCADYFRDERGIIRLYDGKKVRLSDGDFLDGEQLGKFWRYQL